MSNQVINPLIQFNTSDTLHYCSNSLTYLQESLSSLEFGETSYEAQQGICWLMACIGQALDFESNRAINTIPPEYLTRSPTDFEKDVIRDICKQIKMDEASFVVTNPNPRKDN